MKEHTDRFLFICETSQDQALTQLMSILNLPHPEYSSWAILYFWGSAVSQTSVCSQEVPAFGPVGKGSSSAALTRGRF